jgi:hypothetical protein
VSAENWIEPIIRRETAAEASISNDESARNSTFKFAAEYFPIPEVLLDVREVQGREWPKQKGLDLTENIC